MNAAAEKVLTPAATPDNLRTLPTHQQAVRLGNFVLRHEDLGVNDPNAHLLRYMLEGEAAMADIEEDSITDFTERLSQPRFINSVRFNYADNDFRSAAGNHSMQGMTDTTEYKFAKIVDLEQYKRSKTETQEIKKLQQWFENAKIGDAYIAESMGLTPAETYSLTRFYQKIDDKQLDMHVITLHGSTVETFNQLHEVIGVNVPPSESVLGLLENSYPMALPEGVAPKDFSEFYVNAYDSVIAKQNPGQRFRFGLNHAERLDADDDMKMVRTQTALCSIYPKTIRAIANGSGYVSAELVDLNESLAFGFNIYQGQEMTDSLSGELLDHAIQYTMATLNRASKDELVQLATTINTDSVYESVGGYGGSAKAEGTRYDGACPSGSGGAASQNEKSNMEKAFRKKITQCGNCGNCGKEYFVPPEIYRKKIAHCTGCDAAIHIEGGRVDRRIIDKHYGTKPKNPDLLEMLSQEIDRYRQEDLLKQLIGEHAQETNDFKKRRLARMVHEQEEYLQELSAAA